MAFTPDEAIRKKFKDGLSPSAWDFYLFLCMTRNHVTGLSEGTINRFVDMSGIKRATKFKLLRELTDKQWIGGKDGKYNLFVGCFDYVGQSKKLDTSRKTESKNSDNSSNIPEKSKNLDSPPYNPHKDSDLKTNQKERKPEVSKPANSTVNEIFSFWQSIMDHPKAKLTKDRKQKILARLGEKYSVEDIKLAIQGCRSSPFHQGENPNRMLYDDIELICRNGVKLENFINIKRNGAIKNERNQVNNRKRTNTDVIQASADFYARYPNSP